MRRSPLVLPRNARHCEQPLPAVDLQLSSPRDVASKWCGVLCASLRLCVLL
jgi:hypothetical protein